ncbi:MAG: tetratricopeptide repeat protein [Isosphaeraceae bacterium]
MLLAWALLTKPGSSAEERSEALEHARQAVVLVPKNGGFCTTLALAEYRAGHWAESIAAALRSTKLTDGADPANAANWFFLAMARWQQGGRDEARKWLDKAVALTREKDPENAELRPFWAEAAKLLGQPGPDSKGGTAHAETGTGKPR